jgi:hypothetical protein
MIPEYEILGNKVYVICQYCSSTGIPRALSVDERFLAYPCECGRLNLLPTRLYEKGLKKNARERDA